MTEELPDEVARLQHAGAMLRFAVPTPLVRARVQSLLTREPATAPWLRSMAADEVFLDVGANVGLYSIYAALVAGVRVYAFEPESQNYAELNKNIFLNGLHERVSAYCVALSDRFEVSSLHLCTFAVGFGHHDFGGDSWPADLPRGPVVYPKAGRMQQGAVGMTLDELVESGALPVPNHIKVDVDGFEWKVLAGASQTLSRPELRSVLVETDFSSEQSVDTIRFMTERNWQYSDDQVRIFEHELLAPGAIGNRVRRRAGQQNFIYFKDRDTYGPLFGDLAATVAADPRRGRSGA